MNEKVIEILMHEVIKDEEYKDHLDESKSYEKLIVKGVVRYFDPKKGPNDAEFEITYHETYEHSRHSVTFGKGNKYSKEDKEKVSIELLVPTKDFWRYSEDDVTEGHYLEKGERWKKNLKMLQ